MNIYYLTAPGCIAVVIAANAKRARKLASEFDAEHMTKDFADSKKSSISNLGTAKAKNEQVVVLV